MNRALTILILTLSVITVCGQTNARGEFATNTNGLMYSDLDMKALRFVVDSLNLRFKTCDLSRVYYSRKQTYYNYVRFEDSVNSLKDIIADIEKNVAFDELVSKYKNYVRSTDKGDLIIQNYDDEEGFYYTKGTPGNGYESLYMSEEDKGKDLTKNRWYYKYDKPDEYSEEYEVACYYFPEPWKQIVIPTEYAKLIQYVDCMIDTTAQIFLSSNYSMGWDSPDKKKKDFKNLSNLADYLNKKMGDKNKNNADLSSLSEKQVAYVKENLTNDQSFRDILSATIDDYVKHKTVNHQLESLALDMGLYDKALLMKRCYRVMGYCSQDDSPRRHARDIAILAAQAHSWDIFLRAHLDIMNDRFERMSDGSYAWERRKTYLKELEELNLNIVDLMLGLTLRAENAAPNHYYGTIWRLGMALTESKEKDQFEKKAIAMMKDDNLDGFNRGLIFLLYNSYVVRLDKNQAIAKIKAMKSDVSSFPEFMRSSINELDEKQVRDE